MEKLLSYLFVFVVGVVVGLYSTDVVNTVVNEARPFFNTPMSEWHTLDNPVKKQVHRFTAE